MYGETLQLNWGNQKKMIHASLNQKCQDAGKNKRALPELISTTFVSYTVLLIIFFLLVLYSFTCFCYVVYMYTNGNHH